MQQFLPPPALGADAALLPGWAQRYLPPYTTMPDASQQLLPQGTASAPPMPTFPASASQILQETSGALLQHGVSPQQFLQQPGEQAQQVPDASQRMLPQNAAGMPSMPTFPASASQVLQETSGVLLQHGFSPQQLLPQPTPEPQHGSPWPVAPAPTPPPTPEEAAKAADQAQQAQASAVAEVRRLAGLRGGPASWGGM